MLFLDILTKGVQPCEIHQITEIESYPTVRHIEELSRPKETRDGAIRQCPQLRSG